MEKKKMLWNFMKIIGMIAATTLVGEGFVCLSFPETNLVVIYILEVLLVARLVPGYLYGIVTSVLSMMCYNYFFTAPYYTLQVYDSSYLITFAVMLVTSLLMSAITTKENLLKKEAIEATEARVRDLENMERERERANLLRAISHDLRTPLSGIMGTSEMLMDMTEPDDRRQVLLRGIYQDADWLKSLVENILSLTRLQDGRVLIQKESEAVEEIIGAAVAHIERVYPQREILVNIPEEFRLVPMDARLMRQVFTNLLDNAVKHTTNEEEISVTVVYAEQDMIVSVCDGGDGIAEEDLNQLFHIFYTSKSRAADAKKGIGLGLTICETVVKAHGGTICARNREEHKGAEFIVTIPLKEGEKYV